MQDLLNNPGFVALMGTLFGGAGLKIIEQQLGRAKARAADALSMREELRKEIEGLRAQLDKSAAEELRLEGLVDEWKEKYWDYRQKTQEELSTLKQELNALNIELARLRAK